MTTPETIGFVIVLGAIVLLAGVVLVAQWRTGALCPLQHDRYPACRCHRNERVITRIERYTK